MGPRKKPDQSPNSKLNMIKLIWNINKILLFYIKIRIINNSKK